VCNWTNYIVFWNPRLRKEGHSFGWCGIWGPGNSSTGMDRMVAFMGVIECRNLILLFFLYTIRNLTNHLTDSNADILFFCSRYRQLSRLLCKPLLMNSNP
jgi:hypothetical protein